MKLIFIKSLFVVLILLSPLAVNNFNSVNRPNESGVKIDISLEHNDYLPHQSIWITARLANLSQNNYYLKEIFSAQTLQMDIFGPDFSKWRNGYNGLQPRWLDGDSIIFAPGEIKELTYNLCNVYYSEGNHYLPGEYRIKCTYQGIESGTISFQLKKLSKEESEFHDAVYYSVGPSKIEEMINKYPDSKYAPMAFQRLISSFKNEDLLNHQINPDRIGSAINKYMTEYPDEDELYSIITEYDFYFKYTMHYSQEQILSSLENFRKSCRGTKAEKIIENYVLENYCPDNKPNFKNDQAKRLFY